MICAEEPSLSAGLRERKKVETRRTIRQVALDLALELGLENLTVEAIAHAAGVSPRTFFNYFSRKEDALVTDGAGAAATLQTQIVNRPAHESPLHAIRTAIAQNDPFSLLNADRDRALARQKLVQDSPTLLARQLAQYSILEHAFAAAVAHRLQVDPVDDMRPALVASVATAALRVAVQRWTANDVSTSLDKVLGAAFNALEQGLLTHAPERAE